MPPEKSSRPAVEMGSPRPPGRPRFGSQGLRPQAASRLRGSFHLAETQALSTPSDGSASGQDGQKDDPGGPWPEAGWRAENFRLTSVRDP